MKAGGGGEAWLGIIPMGPQGREGSTLSCWNPGQGGRGASVTFLAWRSGSRAFN